MIEPYVTREPHCGQIVPESNHMPVALVTGASTGIGRELADIAAMDGYDVALVARTAGSLEAVAADIKRKTPRQTHIFPIDLSQPNAARELFGAVSQAGLTIDVLVNNAGFGLLGKFWELPEDQQMQMVQLNIGALTQLTRLYLPGMIERRAGYVLNIASTAAFQPGPLMAIYYASKAYVVSFSEAIHNEAKEFGVNVCCLCPGATRTEFQARAGMAGTKLFEGSHVMTAAEVAQIGWTAMKQGKSSVVAGRINAALAFFTRFASRQMAAGIARALQEKK
jgi:short-subunit dehydrogenase